jgi:hypothetical protein
VIDKNKTAVIFFVKTLVLKYLHVHRTKNLRSISESADAFLGLRSDWCAANGVQALPWQHFYPWLEKPFPS